MREDPSDDVWETEPVGAEIHLDRAADEVADVVGETRLVSKLVARSPRQGARRDPLVDEYACQRERRGNGCDECVSGATASPIPEADDNDDQKRHNDLVEEDTEDNGPSAADEPAREAPAVGAAGA